jgi:hypothetical protein
VQTETEEPLKSVIFFLKQTVKTKKGWRKLNPSRVEEIEKAPGVDVLFGTVRS